MTFKQFLESKGITEEAFKGKDASEMAQLHSEYTESRFKALGNSIEGAATKEDVTKAIEKAKEDLTPQPFELKESQEYKDAMSKIEKLEKDLQAAQEDIQQVEAKGVPGEEPNSIAKAIADNFEAVKDSIENKGRTAEFTVVKANVTRASVTNSTDANRLNTIGQLAYRRFVLRNLFPVVTVGPDNNGTIRYTDWDEATKVRAAAMVAEGGVFPESTAAWQEYSLALHKIGDSIPVTEEMLYDQQRFARELDMFLDVNVALVEDQQLFDGNGTGTNLNGIYTTAPTYAAPNAGITDASVYDLLIKLSEAVATGKKSKYQPNFCLMNIADINRMILKKDANNNYVRPPFIQGEAIRVGNIDVIESNAVAANTLLLGDRSFATIYEVEGYNISTGMVNDQFTRDLMTMKAKKRMNLLVRTADQDAFIKCTDITAALTALATP